MTLATRREREREEVRDKILDAARELLSERGFEGVTMREIARRIEYSPTVIYSHFGDKQTLVQELVGEDYQAVGESMQALREISHPLERLRYIGERFAQYALAYPNHYRAIVMTPGPESQNVDEQNGRDIRQDAYQLIRETVEEGIVSGALRGRPGDAELLSQTFIAGLHGVISMQLTPGHDTWLKWQPVMARITTMLETLLDGLARTAQSQFITGKDNHQLSRNISN